MANTLAKLIAKDGEFKIVAETEDRVLFFAPLHRIGVDKDFQAGRFKNPHIEALTRAVKNDDPLYPAIVWPEEKDGVVHLSVIDGMQRLLALTANRKPDALVLVQSFLRWKTKAEAYREGTVGGNALRYGLLEIDLLHIAATSKMSAAELEAYTTLSRKTLDRIVKVAAFSELFPLIESEVMSISQLSSVVDECGSDRKRQERMCKTLVAKYDAAKEESDNAQADIKARKAQGLKPDKGLRLRASIGSYFKGTDWSSFKDDVKAGKEELRIEQSGPKRLKSVRMGDKKDWDNGYLAYYGMDATRFDEVATSDLLALDATWDEGHKHIKAEIAIRLATEKKSPSRDPVREKGKRTRVKKQDASDLTVDNSDDS